MSEQFPKSRGVIVGHDLSCPPCTDADNDGFTNYEGDCDDGNADINPDAFEIAGDGIDQDCDGEDYLFADTNLEAAVCEALGTEDFIAAICQHIPEKFFQMVHYFYSNKSRGMRRKEGILRPGDEPLKEASIDVDIIDVSEYSSPRIPI